MAQAALVPQTALVPLILLRYPFHPPGCKKPRAKPSSRWPRHCCSTLPLHPDNRHKAFREHNTAVLALSIGQVIDGIYTTVENSTPIPAPSYDSEAKELFRPSTVARPQSAPPWNVVADTERSGAINSTSGSSAIDSSVAAVRVEAEHGHATACDDRQTNCWRRSILHRVGKLFSCSPLSLLMKGVAGSVTVRLQHRRIE